MEAAAAAAHAAVAAHVHTTLSDAQIFVVNGHDSPTPLPSHSPRVRATTTHRHIRACYVFCRTWGGWREGDDAGALAMSCRTGCRVASEHACSTHAGQSKRAGHPNLLLATAQKR